MSHPHVSSSIVHKYLDTFAIVVKENVEDKVIPALLNHIEVVIYNITGVAMAVALVNQSFKVESKHLSAVRKYIATSCDRSAKATKAQKGGTSMPSDYFGYRHPNFSEWNADSGTNNVSEVRFAEGIARSEMGGGSDANAMVPFLVHEKLAKKAIKDFLKKHQVTMQPQALHELLAIIDAHMNCLAHDLKAKSAKLDEKNLEKVMKLKRHAVFH